MITTEILLRYRINLTESIFSFGHCLIQIVNDGKGFVIEELSSKDARKFINERNLQKVKKEEYPYIYGDVYTDMKFKNYLNSHSILKNIILKTVEVLDNEN